MHARNVCGSTHSCGCRHFCYGSLLSIITTLFIVTILVFIESMCVYHVFCPSMSLFIMYGLRFTVVNPWCACAVTGTVVCVHLVLC